MRLGTIEAEATRRQIFRGQAFGEVEQHLGIFGVDSAVAVQVVHPPVAVPVDIDVGGIAVSVAAEDGLVADRFVVIRGTVAAHHIQGLGRDSGGAGRAEQALEGDQELGLQPDVRHRAGLRRGLLAKELAQREMRRDREAEIGRPNRHEAGWPPVGGEVAKRLGRVAADPEAIQPGLAAVGSEHEDRSSEHPVVGQVFHLDGQPPRSGRRQESPASGPRAFERDAFRAGDERTASGYCRDLDGVARCDEAGEQRQLRLDAGDSQAELPGRLGDGNRRRGRSPSRRRMTARGGRGDDCCGQPQRSESEGGQEGRGKMVARHAFHSSRKRLGLGGSGRRAAGLLALALLAFTTTAPLAARGEDIIAGALAAGAEMAGPAVYAGIESLAAARETLAAQVAAGGWPLVGSGETLRPGSADPRVPALRRRLAAGGERAGDDESGDLYGPELEAAVRRFQQRHGLLVDGIVGRATLAALDLPAADRLRQVDASLARRRQLPAELGERYLLVNLPAFRLEAVEKGRPVLAMDVVVGRPSMPSPEVVSQVTHLVVNPYWNVPASIASRELAPRESAEPGYLASLGIRVFAGPGGEGELAPEAIDWPAVTRGEQRLFLRQDPGPRNSLGRLSMLMPNDDDICLHDTPEKGAFARSRRALSHGCIRLGDAAALAAYLLRDEPAWSVEALAAAIAGGKRREIRLPSPMPIYLVYWTAWIAADGELEFRDDVYRRDGLGASR